MTDDDLTEPDHTYSVAGIDTPKGALRIVYVDNLKDPSRAQSGQHLAHSLIREAGAWSKILTRIFDSNRSICPIDVPFHGLDLVLEIRCVQEARRLNVHSMIQDFVLSSHIR